MIQVTVLPTVCVRRVKGDLKRIIELRIKATEPVDPLEAELTVERKRIPLRLTVPRGESRHQCEIEEPESPVVVALQPSGHVTFDTAEATVTPHRPWDIYLLHHSHNDLGYTDMPTRVSALHADYLDRVVQYCAETARYPKDARFRWNIECSWQLQNYALRRPAAAVGKLHQLIKDGRVDVSAWYLNMTDVGNAEETLRSLYFIHDYARRNRLPLRSSMSCDVNGYPWCLPSVLDALGVECHLSALNTTRSISPLDRPCAFHWVAPDARKVLLWHGDHYHMGNYIGFHDRPDHFLERLTEYLHKLEHKGYPYPMALIQVSGTFGDNAPPARELSDFVRSWNRTYRSPRIRLTTMGEWFDRLKKEMADDVPDLRQAWPDYWADGLASAPIETSRARRDRHTLARAETAHTALHLLGRKDHAVTLDPLYDEATFANEHTWGHKDSVHHPFAPPSLAHWYHKAGYFHRTSIGAGTILREATRSCANLVPAKGDEPALAVFNWLSRDRDGVVEVDLPLRMLREEEFHILDAETGDDVPCQILGEGNERLRLAIRARGVPAFGYRTYTVRHGRGSMSDPHPVPEKGSTLENDYLTAEVDRSGAISRLQDRIRNRKLVNEKESFGLGRLITEEIIHGEGREALNGWWFRDHRNKSPENEIFKRGQAGNGRVVRHERGTIFSEIEVEPKSDALDRLRTTIRLSTDESELRVVVRLRKPLNPDPHALYFAFPFDLSEPEVWFDAAGGPFRPGSGQISGSCMDFYTIQDYALLRNSELAVLWIPLDSPLVQLNTITTADWIRVPPPATSTLFAWAYNNYWTTNFPVTACGDFIYEFVIRVAGPETDFAAARQTAAEAFSPLSAEILGGPNEGSLSGVSGSLLSVEPENVFARTMKPAKNGKGIVLRLEETSGRDTEAVIAFHVLDPVEVHCLDLFEEKEKGGIRLHEKECTVPIPAFGVRTIGIGMK